MIKNYCFAMIIEMYFPSIQMFPRIDIGVINVSDVFTKTQLF